MSDSNEVRRHSIGREAAIAFADSKWWERKTAREIARLQLFTTELCCPFGVFHKAVEESLGRPVWSHEFAFNYDGIVREFLGDQSPPTMQQIIDLIPPDKRVVLEVQE